MGYGRNERYYISTGEQHKLYTLRVSFTEPGSGYIDEDGEFVDGNWQDRDWHIKNLGNDEVRVLGHVRAYERYNKVRVSNKDSFFSDLNAIATKTEVAARERRIRHARWNKIREALRSTPELSGLLKVDHHITKDIRSKVINHPEWTLSKAQINLLRKLQADTQNPEINVPIPARFFDGRNRIEGKIVSVKLHENDFGASYKMTVKVTEAEGVWLVWGSVPSSIDTWDRDITGESVAFDATLAHGNDKHFGFFKRPTKAILT